MHGDQLGSTMTKIVPELSDPFPLQLAEVEQRARKIETAITRQHRFVEVFEHFGPFDALGESLPEA
jgi:hypothetical protein